MLALKNSVTLTGKKPSERSAPLVANFTGLSRPASASVSDISERNSVKERPDRRHERCETREDALKQYFVSQAEN